MNKSKLRIVYGDCDRVYEPAANYYDIPVASVGDTVELNGKKFIVKSRQWKCESTLEMRVDVRLSRMDDE